MPFSIPLESFYNKNWKLRSSGVAIPFLNSSNPESNSELSTS